MKKLFGLFLLLFGFLLQAQEMVLKKGMIMDSVPVINTQESFSLYLPTSFDVTKSWPVVFILDMEGKSRQIMSLFRPVAEQNGYILAAPNNLSDTIPATRNILVANRSMNQVFALLPIHENRVYVAGEGDSGALATVMPMFVTGISGAISCGAFLAPTQLVQQRQPYYYIGIVGDRNYNYVGVEGQQRYLNGLKYPNEILTYEGDATWPEPQLLDRALRYYTLAAMAKGQIPKDNGFIDASYAKDRMVYSKDMGSGKRLAAYDDLLRINRNYRAFKDMDSINQLQKQLRKDKLYRTQQREESTNQNMELLERQKYYWNLQDDFLTQTYENLGWWQFQIEQLNSKEKTSDETSSKMASRLKGYINATIATNFDTLDIAKPEERESLKFLYMLKTITAPKDYEYYLKTISVCAQTGDNGSALYYLEELLKQGYTNKKKLYSLEGTALLKITPEFNALVEQYLKDSRYSLPDD